MMPPPYGGPHPSYGAMYPPGGMYGHPMYGQYGTPTPDGMAGAEQGADGKAEAKGSDGGKAAPLKRSKGSKSSLQLLKVSDSGGKGNGVSQSVSNGEEGEHDGETGSDEGGSTDASREENAQNLLGGKRSFEQLAMEAVGAPAYMGTPGDARARRKLGHELGLLDCRVSAAGEGGNAGVREPVDERSASGDVADGREGGEAAEEEAVESRVCEKIEIEKASGV